MRRPLDDVQEEMIGKILRHASGHDSGIYEAATGTGKTRTAAKLCQRMVPATGRPALFLANRIELIRQTKKAFDALGLACEVEMGDLRASHHLQPGSMFGRPDVIIASHLSLHPDRVRSYDPDAFGLVIADEAHLAAADSWTHIFDYFRSTYRLGLTATPYRMDGVKLYGSESAPFRDLVCRYTLPEAIADGNLVPIRAHTIGKDMDLSGLSTRGLDLDTDELEAYVLDHVDEMANAAADQFARLGSRKAILFTPDVNSSKVVAKVLTRLGYPTLAVHGNTPKHPMSDDRRKAILESFEKGEVFGLANCEVCTTGYDCPPIDAVVLMLATKSLVGFTQRVGRGTRRADGKDHVDVIGYSWVGQEGLVSTVDLFGVDIDDLEIRARARKKACKAAPDADLGGLMDEARAEVEAEREQARQEEEERQRVEAEDLAARERARVERQARALDVRRRRTDYLLESFEPFRAAIEARRRAADPGGADRISTTGQVRFLRERGIDGTAMDHATARACVDEILHREAWGLCSPAQEAWLVRNGVAGPAEARAWTAADVRREMGRQFGRRRNAV